MHVTRFTLRTLRNRPDAPRVLDRHGCLRVDHPDLLDDPEFVVRGRDGTIRKIRQSEGLAEQRKARLGLVINSDPAGGTPVTTVNPALPLDAGPTDDFSHLPYMRAPFAGDQGTQRNLADCYFVAPLTSFAKLRPSVLWTAGKQIGPKQFRTRFYASPNYPSTSYQTAIDVVTDGVLPSSNFDDVGDDGTTWLKFFVRHYAYARLGKNTYDSLNWGFPSQTMLDLGVFPSTYSIFDPSIMTTIMSALTNNPCVVASTHGAASQFGLVNAHVYSIVGARPATASAPAELDLDNPWKGYGVQTVKLSTFQQAFSSVTVGGVVAFPMDPVFTPYTPPAPDYPAVLASVKGQLENLAEVLVARKAR